MVQNTISELHKERLKFKPVLPAVLKKGIANIKPVLGKATKSVADFDKIKAIFEKTYGMPVVNFKSGKKNNSFGLSIEAFSPLYIKLSSK